MKKALIQVIVIAMLVPSRGLAQSTSFSVPPDYQSGNWNTIGKSGELDFSFSPTYLRVLPGGKRKAWIKRSLPPSPENLERVIRELRDAGQPTEGYEDFQYSVVLVEIDCVQRKMRTLTTIDYALFRRELGSRTNSRPAWTGVVPGSFPEVQLDALCAAAIRRPPPRMRRD